MTSVEGDIFHVISSTIAPAPRSVRLHEGKVVIRVTEKCVGLGMRLGCLGTRLGLPGSKNSWDRRRVSQRNPKNAGSISLSICEREQDSSHNIN